MTLSSESAERIELLQHVAKENGSLVSVKDLSRLLGERASESEVADAIDSFPSLKSKFELRGGFLTERNVGPEVVQLETASRRRAKANLVHASRFVSLLHSNPFEMIAVSGSTSYGSASLSRDLDLFCVAPKGRMWTALTKGLLMARAYAMTNRSAPTICLSYVMDEEYAGSRFASQRDPLFARDAIETKVVKGWGAYQSLMKKANWISRLYPAAYHGIVDNAVPDSSEKGASNWHRVLNKLLFATVGQYIWLKAALTLNAHASVGQGCL